MPEVEIDLGEQGEVVGAHLASNDVSHQIIEDFMLAANEARRVATDRASGGAFIRRVHADPEPRKLLQFAEFARSLGFEIEQALSRFELQKLLDEAKEKPEAYAVHFGLLRSLKQAVYSPEAGGALRPGQRRLLPLHLPDPPLPRPPGPPPAHGLARRQEAPGRLRRAGRAGRALHQDRTPGRARRA